MRQQKVDQAEKMRRMGGMPMDGDASVVGAFGGFGNMMMSSNNNGMIDLQEFELISTYRKVQKLHDFVAKTPLKMLILEA